MAKRSTASIFDAGIPTCVVWGAEDLITPAAAAGVFTALFGRDAVHVLQGAGHLPFVEAPASVGLMLERHFAAPRPGF
jgi:pimeloyl-ACP methyl ester carboxylesterase